MYSCRTDNALNSNEEILQRKKFYYISKNEITNKSITKKIEDLQANSIVKRTSKKTMLDGIKINEDKVLVFEDKEGNEDVFNLLTGKKEIILNVDPKKIKSLKEWYELIKVELDAFIGK